MLAVASEPHARLKTTRASCLWRFHRRITQDKAGLLLQLHFSLSRAECSLLTALPLKLAQRDPGVRRRVHTPWKWGGKGEGGSDNTDVAPFLLESAYSTTRDHKASLISLCK